MGKIMHDYKAKCYVTFRVLSAALSKEDFIRYGRLLLIFSCFKKGVSKLQPMGQILSPTGFYAAL